jgi:hypothetical protein
MIAGVIIFIVVGTTEIIISLIFIAGLLSLLFMYFDEKRWSRKSPGETGMPRQPGPVHSAKTLSSRANGNTPLSTKYGQEAPQHDGRELSPGVEVSGFRHDEEVVQLHDGRELSPGVEVSGFRHDEPESTVLDEQEVSLQDEQEFAAHDVQEPSHQDTDEVHPHDIQKPLHLDLGEVYPDNYMETYLQDVQELASNEPPGQDEPGEPSYGVSSTTDTPSAGSAERSDSGPQEDAGELEMLEALQQETIEYILSVNASDRIAASDWTFYDQFLQRMDAQRSRCCEIIAARRTVK